MTGLGMSPANIGRARRLSKSERGRLTGPRVAGRAGQGLKSWTAGGRAHGIETWTVDAREAACAADPRIARPEGNKSIGFYS